jgi:hypothetical protein
MPMPGGFKDAVAADDEVSTPKIDKVPTAQHFCFQGPIDLFRPQEANTLLFQPSYLLQSIDSRSA